VTKNVAQSVRDRLLTLSKERGEAFNFVLVRYGLERLLYRLARSPCGDEFVLKGAMLFTVWSKHPHRATKDLDLHGSGSPDVPRLAAVFREVCATDVEDDGVVFDAKSVSANRIKEDAEYEGVRISLDGKLGSAKLALQVDVGFGDAITPKPTIIEFPTLLPLPPPRIRAYPRETVVAEKLHAMVYLGLTNSRMKDFFDVWFLCREFEFQGGQLVSAVRATFDRRSTPIPKEVPIALSESFGLDGGKQAQWKAFLQRSGVAAKTLTLSEVVGMIAPFLLPALRAGRADGPLPSAWAPGGPWGFNEPDRV
jgi:predicted nucleotidyltransferase component of viral defense system